MHSLNPRRHPVRASLLLLILTWILSWSVGGSNVYPWDLLEPMDPSQSEITHQILFNVRLPRLLAACLLGMALGTAGTVSQGLFRNSLASPSLLGISSGGTLGVVTALYLGLADSTPWMIPILAFAGCFSTMLLVLRFAKSAQQFSIEELLLIGLALNSILSSLSTLLLSFALQEGERGASLMNWMLGTLSGKTWQDNFWILPTLTVGLLICLRQSYRLNLLALGTDQAEALGLSLSRFRVICIIGISLLVASSVSLGGLLPFVGLLVPHLSRLLTGPDHRKLMPVSLINGITLITLADLVARTIISPLEIQVGVLISLLGSPFFLWLLLNMRSAKTRL